MPLYFFGSTSSCFVLICQDGVIPQATRPIGGAVIALPTRPIGTDPTLLTIGGGPTLHMTGGDLILLSIIVTDTVHGLHMAATVVHLSIIEDEGRDPTPVTRGLVLLTILFHPTIVGVTTDQSLAHLVLQE